MLNEFIQYLIEQEQNHSIYVWGGQGQHGFNINEAWIKKMERDTGGYANESYADAAISFWKKQVAAGFGSCLRAFDCSGLGIYFLYNLKKLYPGDATAHGMWGRCKKKLTRAEFKRGDWVFRGSVSRMTHIGYIVDDEGTVIEAKGRKYGVCKSHVNSKLSNGTYYWQFFARPDVFINEIENQVAVDSPNISSVEIVGGSVNVRSSDGPTGKILYVAHKGQLFPFKGLADSGWYRITLTSDMDGYISNADNLTKLV